MEVRLRAIYNLQLNNTFQNAATMVTQTHGPSFPERSLRRLRLRFGFCTLRFGRLAFGRCCISRPLCLQIHTRMNREQSGLGQD